MIWMLIAAAAVCAAIICRAEAQRKGYSLASAIGRELRRLAACLWAAGEAVDVAARHYRKTRSEIRIEL